MDVEYDVNNNTLIPCAESILFYQNRKENTAYDSRIFTGWWRIAFPVFSKEPDVELRV